jgi:hypothetical protein
MAASWALGGCPGTTGEPDGKLTLDKMVFGGSCLGQECLEIYQNEAEQISVHRSYLGEITKALSDMKEPCAWRFPEAYCLKPDAISDLAWLSQRLEPYRLIVSPDSVAVATSEMEALPALSDTLFSRERGQLLEALGRERIVTAIIQTADAFGEPRLTFEAAYLPSGALYNADLSGANLRGAWLAHAQMEGATAVDAHFERANLSSADLQYSVLWGSSFEGADLGGAYLDKAELADSNLTLADLKRASLEGADLSGASIILADLRGAHFGDAEISDEQLASACLDEATLVANRRKYLRSAYSLPPACKALWPGEIHRQEWTLFSAAEPPLGTLIRVTARSRKGEVSYETSGRWNGQTVLRDEGKPILSGEGELQSWRLSGH